jgi:aspartyl-tRNA(Asn)/glutamyl-tRNA(Gln) amidotransferase subunit A
VATKLERALRVSDEEVERAARERELYRERVAGAMARLDLLLTPTLAMVAPPSGVGDLALRDDMLRFTLPWNAVGAPALALPCGPADIGLPASVQLIGRPGDDPLVLAAGRALEERLSAQTGGGSR